jgi:hypothetical protein
VLGRGRVQSPENWASHSTVREYLGRIAAAGLTWPLPAEVTDAELERRLFVNGGVQAAARYRVEPDWATVVRELKRPGVNLMILWEHRTVHPEGYAYSRYCELFREFERKLSPSMRQNHVAGDKVFVDYSGKKIRIIDPATGGDQVASSGRLYRLNGHGFESAQVEHGAAPGFGAGRVVPQPAGAHPLLALAGADTLRAVCTALQRGQAKCQGRSGPFSLMLCQRAWSISKPSMRGPGGDCAAPVTHRPVDCPISGDAGGQVESVAAIKP